MKILVIGAGVVGAIFAWQLSNAGQVRSSPESHDKGVARRLWQTSGRLVGQKFVRPIVASVERPAAVAKIG
jgi:hypothetical protein